MKKDSKPSLLVHIMTIVTLFFVGIVFLVVFGFLTGAYIEPEDCGEPTREYNELGVIESFVLGKDNCTIYFKDGRIGGYQSRDIEYSWGICEVLVENKVLVFYNNKQAAWDSRYNACIGGQDVGYKTVLPENSQAYKEVS